MAEYYGFKDKMMVKRLLDRARKKERTIPKFRGKKPAKTLQEYQYEKPKSLREANLMIDRYIDFYNNERIQTKSGVAPLTLRHS